MVSGYFHEVSDWEMRLLNETGRLCGCVPRQDDYAGLRLHDRLTSNGLALPAMCRRSEPPCTVQGQGHPVPVLTVIVDAALQDEDLWFE